MTVSAQISEASARLEEALARARRILEPALAELKSEIAQIEQTLDDCAIGTMPTVGSMLTYVAFAQNLRRADILSERRGRDLARARFAVAWAAKHLLKYSYPRIGRALGRHHSSIVHAVEQAELLRAGDPDFLQLTDRLAAEFDPATPPEEKTPCLL